MLKSIGKTALYVFAFIGFFLTAGFFAMKFGFTNEPGVVDNQRSAFLEHVVPSTHALTPEWANDEEWLVLREAIIRDRESINHAAELAHVSPRLIVAQLVVEQLRLFHSNRELFKAAFAPLRILGNQSQFSWGVVGIKQETAIAIEEYLKDRTSPFYLGGEFEHLLDFTTSNHDKERFDRIVNEQDRFYSYLYVALDLKETMAQWKNAGYDISDKVGIISTLFNIGFQHSLPHANPESGGAAVVINGETYSFGSLAREFYNSELLVNEFPKN